jgi:hypothetical protein
VTASPLAKGQNDCPIREKPFSKRIFYVFRPENIQYDENGMEPFY